MADLEHKGWVRQRWEEAQAPLLTPLRSYWLNHAFLLGHQWLQYDKETQQVTLYPEDADRIQAVNNRMRANMRILFSNLMQRELGFEVQPDAFDDQTVGAARLAESVLQNTRRDHSWEELRELLLTTTLKGGTGAVVIDWDEPNEDSIEEVVSLAEMGVEPGAPRAQFARYWTRAQVLPPSEVKNRFPEAYPDTQMPPSDFGAGLASFSRKMLGTHLGRSAGADMTPLTLVLTYYERPNNLTPEGKVIVEVGGKRLHESDWPFPFEDRLNFAIMRETIVENQWYGATFLDDVRPLQVMYNVMWSNFLEHLTEAGVARMLVPQSAADLTRQLRDIPGEMLEYPDGVAPPSYMTPPQLPGWMHQLLSQIAESIDDNMGVHDVTRGQAPANIESGYGLSILAEKDSSPVGKLIKETARVFSEISQMHLQLVEAEVKEKRDTSVRMASGPERRKWSGKDIRGQWHATVPLDAIVPRSRAASQAFADKAMQMGLVTDFRAYALLAELPGARGLVASVNQQVGKAIRENEKFGQSSEPIIPATFDDHGKHIELHNEFRSTERYEEMSDEQQADVDMHIVAHQNFAAEQVAKQVQRAMADPNLAKAPSSDGIVDVPIEIPEEGPIPEEPLPPEEEEIPDEALNPEALTQDIVASLDATS